MLPANVQESIKKTSIFALEVFRMFKKTDF